MTCLDKACKMIMTKGEKEELSVHRTEMLARPEGEQHFKLRPRCHILHKTVSV